jgi:hypothetical protein
MNYFNFADLSFCNNVQNQANDGHVAGVLP